MITDRETLYEIICRQAPELLNKINSRGVCPITGNQNQKSMIFYKLDKLPIEKLQLIIRYQNAIDFLTLRKQEDVDSGKLMIKAEEAISMFSGCLYKNYILCRNLKAKIVYDFGLYGKNVDLLAPILKLIKYNVGNGVALNTKNHIKPDRKIKILYKLDGDEVKEAKVNNSEITNMDINKLMTMLSFKKEGLTKEEFSAIMDLSKT